MNKFTNHLGTLTPLYQANIDTDQIIPKQFLKRIERSGYGAFLFYDWRFDAAGSPNPDFVLNDPLFAGSSILISGANFGCGSSREHAPWSLLDYGFRVIIAPSFADIFYNNSLKNGLLPVVMSEENVEELAATAKKQPGHQLSVDLVTQLVSDDCGFEAGFDIDAFRKHCLLNGLDEIALTLEQEDKISKYEQNRGNKPRFSYLQH